MLRAGKYSDILNFSAQTLLRRLGGSLETLMRPDEPIEDSAGREFKLAGFDDRQYNSTMKLGNYRPFRHRSGINRAVPPGTKRTGKARRL